MQDLSRRFKALSEEPRLEIFALLLRYRELCGCEVERFLKMSQSKASRHLRYLRNAGLVEDRREGLWIYYRIAEPVDPAHERLLKALRDLLVAVPLPDIEKELAAMRARRCAAAPERNEPPSRGGEDSARRLAKEAAR